MSKIYKTLEPRQASLNFQTGLLLFPIKSLSKHPLLISPNFDGYSKILLKHKENRYFSDVSKKYEIPFTPFNFELNCNKD